MSFLSQSIKKLWHSDDSRPTRFHTGDSRLVGWRGAAEFPVSLLSYAILRIFGVRLLIPWWTWSAIWFVKRTISREDVVLEDGAGMSTLWLAHHCSLVVSIERSSEWRNRVQGLCRRRNLNNVRLIAYDRSSIFKESYSLRQFSVVVIDGPADRLTNLKQVLSAQVLPRMIVFDNSDRSENILAHSLAIEHGYSARRFRGFAPSTVNAMETAVFIKRRTA